jgi:predicted permease
MSAERPPRPRARSSAERVTAALLRLAPRDFRDEAGGEIVELARAASHDARTQWQRVRLVGRVAADVLRAAAAERLGSRLRIRAAEPPGASLFGPAHPTRNDVMDGLPRDLRHAARNLARSPGLVAVVTLTLMLGIGLNTVIFGLVDQLLLRELPLADPERVVRVYTSDRDSGPLGSTSFPDYLDFREQAAASLANLAAFADTLVQLDAGRAGGGVEQVAAEVVTGNYFETLGLQPYAGRFLGASEPGREDPTEAVLSYAAFESRFAGDPRAIGGRVRVNGRSFTIVGVAPPRFRGLDAGSRPDLWLPMSAYADAIPWMRGRDRLVERGSRWLDLVGRLAGGAEASSAQAALQTVMDRLAEAHPDTNLGIASAPDQPRPMTVLGARHGRLGRALEATTSTSRMLFVLVGLVLLVACVNVASVLLARGVERRREVAIRVALGAGRARVVRQLLLEGTLLALLGGAAGLLFAWLASRALAADVLPSLATGLAVEHLRLDARVLAFTAALSLATGLACGLAPALRLRGGDLLPALRTGRTHDGGPSRRFGPAEALVVVQVAGACVLLVAAGLLARSLGRLVALDLGFEREGVVLAQVAPALQGYDPQRGVELYRALLEETAAIPGVEAAALSSAVPVQPSGARRGVRIEGYQPGPTESTEININFVSPGFFETLQVPLLRGRAFGPADHAEAPRVAIVNEAFVERYWASSASGGDALGRRIGGEELEIEIVGVAADGKYRQLREDPMPYIYVPLAQDYRPAVTLAVRSASGDPRELLPAVRAAVERLDPDLPLTEVRLLREHVGEAAAPDRSLALVVGSFSALTLALSAIGLFGVLATAVARRRRELGIRSALGARRGELLALVFSRGLALAGAGFALGTAGAIATSRLLAARLFEVRPGDPWTYAIVLVLLAGTAALACLVPARRATAVDPAAVLRME